MLRIQQNLMTQGFKIEKKNGSDWEFIGSVKTLRDAWMLVFQTMYP